MSRVIAYEVTLKTDWEGELLCETHFERHTVGGGYIAGSALTGWNCKYCGGNHTHANTAHPQICLGCAIQRGECQRCLIKLGKTMTLVRKEIRSGDE